MHRRVAVIAGLGLLLVFAAIGRSQEHGMEKPTKEHAWLEQLAGEWEADFEASMGPGQPGMKGKGSEKSSMLGGFWYLAEGEANMGGMAVKSRLTLGYDPEKKKYIGTWVDSISHQLWKYEGTVDATGKKLTLDTEGPNMMTPGKTAKYQETIEVKGPDHKVFTSSILGEDGKWFTFMKADYRRKK